MAATHSRKAGPGRPKGSQNKTTVTAKEAIEDAFNHLQGIEGADFRTWANLNRDDFYKLLYPKLLPLQLNHADNEGGKLQFGWLTDHAHDG
jgi:hypothetical protein